MEATMICADIKFEVDSAAIRNSKLCEQLSVSHRGLMHRTNGAYAFDRCLHIFGVGSGVSEFHDIERWNSESSWRREYGDLAEGLIFFAETIFGDQFCFDRQFRVHKFLAETGHLIAVGESFDAWLNELERHADDLLDMEAVKIWLGGQTMPSAGVHICPLIPFSLGGAIARGADAYLCDAIEDMFFKGQLASQLKGLRPGEKVDLRAINLPKASDGTGPGPAK